MAGKVGEYGEAGERRHAFREGAEHGKRAGDIPHDENFDGMTVALRPRPCREHHVRCLSLLGMVIAAEIGWGGANRLLPYCFPNSAASLSDNLSA